MFELVDQDLGNLPSDTIHPPAISEQFAQAISLEEAFIHERDGELAYGVISREPPASDQFFRSERPSLSFGAITANESGLIIGDVYDNNIASYFTGHYGPAPITMISEKSILDMWGDSEGPKDLRWPDSVRLLAELSEERKVLFEEQFGIEDFSKIPSSCIPGADIPEAIRTIDYTRDTQEHIFITASLDNIEYYTLSGPELVATITDPENDVLVCGLDDGNLGAFYPGPGVFNLNYEASPHSDKPLRNLTDEESEEVFSDAFITAYEELVHAKKFLEGQSVSQLLEGGANFRSDHHMLAFLIDEGYAKLNKVMEVVRGVYELDGASTQIYDAMLQIGDGEADMAEYLLARVRGKESTAGIIREFEGQQEEVEAGIRGYEAFNDPDTLRNAFSKFFGSQLSMDQYFCAYQRSDALVRALAQNASEQEMPVDKIIDFYGTTIGQEEGANFLAGLTFEALATEISESSPMRDWIFSLSPDRQSSYNQEKRVKETCPEIVEELGLEP